MSADKKTIDSLCVTNRQLMEQLAYWKGVAESECDARKEMSDRLDECEREREVFKQCNRTSYDALATVTAERDELVIAAKAVVDRWDSPLWKDLPHTGNFIGALRAALAKVGADETGEKV